MNSRGDIVPAGGRMLPVKDHTHEPGHQALSKTLTEVLAGVSGEIGSAGFPAGVAAGDLTLNRLLEQTAGRSLYLLVVILCLPFMIPVSVPGLSTIMGSIIAFLMLRQVLGKRPRLPRFLGEKKMPPKVQHRVLGGSIKFLAFLEKLVRPRRTRWLASRSAVVLNALIIAFLALLLALPLPAPPFFFSNSLPSYAIVVLAISVMEEDGLTIWVGYALVLVNLLFFSLIGGVIFELLLKLWRFLSHAAGV